MDECMAKLRKTDKFAVAVSRNYLHAKPFDKNIYCFQKPMNIRSDLVTLKMRITSVDLVEWNKRIQRIAESGLLAKWARSTTGATKRSNEIEMQEDGYLNVEHFFGLLCFSSFGYILAITIAILEHIIYYKLKQPNHHRYWNVAGRVIDGRRYMFFIKRNNSRNHRDNGTTRNRNRWMAWFGQLVLSSTLEIVSVILSTITNLS